ncbi:MAG: cytochrome P450 [Pyrinomonadaceae bacterium]
MKSRNAPTVRGNIFGGHFFKFRKDPTGFLTSLSELGDVAGMRMFNRPSFFINHPDLIRDVLVTNHSKFHKGVALQRAKPLLGEGLLTSEGERHLRHRRMIQPAFHKQRIAEYAASMSEYADDLCAGWREGETLEIDREMARLTLRIVGKTLFGTDVSGAADEVGQAMTDLMDRFDFMLLPFSNYLEKLPLAAARKSRNARANLDSVIFRVIEERRKTEEDHGDLLSMLLLAQDENSGLGMSDKEVRDEALTLFIAGHETTANALVFTLFLLAQNPKVAAELQGELDAVLAGRLPTFEDVPKLPFTESVIAESMRLFPPAWALGRLAIEEHSLGGFHVPKGSLIILSPYVIHRDSRFWDRAGEFVPDRWTRASIRQKGQEFVYIPFSKGVRSCVGESFAWMELILLVSVFASRWNFKLHPEQVFGLKPLMTLRPKFGMRLICEKRNAV